MRHLTLLLALTAAPACAGTFPETLEKTATALHTGAVALGEAETIAAAGYRAATVARVAKCEAERKTGEIVTLKEAEQCLGTFNAAPDVNRVMGQIAEAQEMLLEAIKILYAAADELEKLLPAEGDAP